MWRRVWPSALLVTALACGAAAAEAPITVAVVGPFSGQYAAVGGAMRDAAGAGIKRLEGTLGPVRLIVEDDGCDAATAVAAAQRVVAAKPDVVVGHPCSGAAIAAAAVYAQAGVVMITPGARHPDLTDRRAWPGIFRLAGRDDRQAAVAATALAAMASGKAIVIMDDRTFHMSSLAKDVAARLDARLGGASPRVRLQFVASEFDYGRLVTAAAAAGEIGAIFFAGYPQEAIVVLRQLRARGIAAPFVGSDALATSELGAALGGTSGEVRVLRPADAPDAAGVGERTLAAVEIWGQAKLRAGPSALAAALGAGTWPTTQFGPVAFDGKGDAQLPSYVVCSWGKGAWQPVKTTADHAPVAGP